MKDSRVLLGVVPGIGSSLSDFARQGQIERLLDHYLPAYLERFERIRVFSYEPERLEAFTSDRDILRRVEVIAPDERVARRRFALRLGVGRPAAAMRACSIVRVLQAPGALPALVARARYICTFGYSYAAFMDVPFRRFARPARPLKRAAMRAVLRAVLRGATATIVTTSAGSTEARLLGARDVRLIPNGVDVDLFAPHERRDLDVVFVGQLVPRKDVSTLIAAVAKLGSPVRLHVVGDGPERPTLERQAAESGVDAQFVGTRPNSEIAELLGRTRCFVLPSHAEGHPKALLEAMAAGAACIGTAIDAVLEVDGDGALRLVPPGDSTALAIALADVLAGPVTAEELGRRAREVILDRFDLRRLLDMETRLLVDFARAPAANDASQGPLVEASHDGPEARAR